MRNVIHFLFMQGVKVKECEVFRCAVMRRVYSLFFISFNFLFFLHARPVRCPCGTQGGGGGGVAVLTPWFDVQAFTVRAGLR